MSTLPTMPTPNETPNATTTPIGNLTVTVNAAAAAMMGQLQTMIRQVAQGNLVPPNLLQSQLGGAGAGPRGGPGPMAHTTTTSASTSASASSTPPSLKAEWVPCLHCGNVVRESAHLTIMDNRQTVLWAGCFDCLQTFIAHLNTQAALQELVQKLLVAASRVAVQLTTAADLLDKATKPSQQGMHYRSAVLSLRDLNGFNPYTARNDINDLAALQQRAALLLQGQIIETPRSRLEDVLTIQPYDAAHGKATDERELVLRFLTDHPDLSPLIFQAVTSLRETFGGEEAAASTLSLTLCYADAYRTLCECQPHLLLRVLTWVEPAVEQALRTSWLTCSWEDISQRSHGLLALDWEAP